VAQYVTDQGGGKRRSVTLFCHIWCPDSTLLCAWGRRHAHTHSGCRLHRHWLSIRSHAWNGGDGFAQNSIKIAKRPWQSLSAPNPHPLRALRPGQSTPAAWHVRRDPPRLVFCQQLGRGSPARLLLKVDIGQLLAAAVLHDKAGFQFLDRPGRREAARHHFGRYSTPSIISTICSGTATSIASPPAAAFSRQAATCRQVDLSRCPSGRCSSSTRTSASVLKRHDAGEFERPRQWPGPVRAGQRERSSHNFTGNQIGRTGSRIEQLPRCFPPRYLGNIRCKICRCLAAF
jgi:hypothetical protein